MSDRQKLRARIDLFTEAIYLTRYGANGPTSCHEIAPIDLASAFFGTAIASPLLPPNCINWARVDGRDRFVLYLPPTRREVIILESDGERTLLELPFPGLVWVGHGHRYHLWAVKQRPSQMSERLFAAPFPNIDGAKGTVCWGNAKKVSARADTIHDALTTFLKSDFNNHWINACSQKFPEDVRDLWRELDRPDTPEAYPLDDLVKTRYVLGDIL